MGLIRGQIDDEEIKAELAELEQEELNDRLAGADKVPAHSPGPSSTLASGRVVHASSSPRTGPPVRTVAQRRQEDDEDAELKELQAALAM